MGLLGLLLLLFKLSLGEKFGLVLLCLINGGVNRLGSTLGSEREADLKTEDFHLHHLNLQVLSLLNICAGGERWSGGIYLGGSALLIGESIAVYSRSAGTVAESVWNVEVLGFLNVLMFLIVGSKPGEVESSARSGGVGNVGGIGANTACAKSSEERSTVVLVRYGHLGGIGRESDLLESDRKRERLHERSRARGGTTGWMEGVRKQKRTVETVQGTDVERVGRPDLDYFLFGGDI